MTEYQEQNAIVESVTLETERGLSAWLTLNYGDGGMQGFGGFLLYAPKGWRAHESKGNYAGHFIYRCCQVAGVERWERIPGKTIRVRREPGFNGLVKAIGHIVNDDWFNPSEDFQGES